LDPVVYPHTGFAKVIKNRTLVQKKVISIENKENDGDSSQQKSNIQSIRKQNNSSQNVNRKRSIKDFFTKIG
jgi:hypothetical protein